MRVIQLAMIAAVVFAQSPSVKSGSKKPTPTEAPAKGLKTTDVEGWGKVKWGMTIAQVRALYPGVLQISEEEPKDEAKYVGRLAAKNFRIGDLEMNLSV